MTSEGKKRRYYQKWLKELSGHSWIVKKRFWLRVFLWVSTLLTGAVATALLLAIGFQGFAYFYTGNLKDDHGEPLDFSKIKRGDFKKASYVYDYSGQEVLGGFFEEIRNPITAEQVPDLLAKAFIAAEDKNFYASFHRGVDPFAVARAGTYNTLSKLGVVYNRPKSGASGIPQQVARLVYAREVESFRNRTPSYKRKQIEAQVAIQLVRRYDKRTILTTFLNQIYFDHGANGVAEAYRYYFGKDLKDEKLSLREISILVSLNKSPLVYCPVFHEPAKPKIDRDLSAEAAQVLETKYEAELAKEHARVILARERYNWVLGRMWEEGYISKTELEEARFKKEEPLKLELLHVSKLKDPRFGYGNRVVKEMLFNQGFSDEEILSSRGLHIRTGFDPVIQKIMAEEVNKQLAAVNAELAGSDKLEGSFVAIENKTGRVVALSGGHDFSETQYNRALALRSPGSAFKPVVFAAALQAGKTFDDKICNCPFSMRGANGKRWAPRNFKEENPVPFGYRPLPQILIRSVNLGTLNLAREIGMGPIIETAHRLGIWGEKGVFRDPEREIWFKTLGADPESGRGLEPLLPTAIGASDISLLELANAYTVFARGGTYLKPVMIWEIRDASGQVIYRAEPQSEERVLSEETARKIVILLRAVTKVGTAKISMRNIVQQVAAKTGTSNGPNDLLLVWFTPEYTFAIRFGYDYPRAIALPVYMKKQSGVAGMSVSGGWVAGPAARRVTDRVYEYRPKVEFSVVIEEGVQELLEKFSGKI